MMKKTLAFAVLTNLAFATLPHGELVKSGEVAFQREAGSLSVTASDRAIIEWKSFSIGTGEAARFLQPTNSSVVLNQIVGNLRSEILGQLQANGRVFLVNPNGIIIGQDAVINTAAFLASTLPVNQEAFLAGGDLLFKGESTAEIINLGTIQAKNGFVTLLAHKVDNRGMIQSSHGDAVLASGHEILLKSSGETILHIRPDQKGAGIEQTGLIQVIQQTEDLCSLAVNQGPETLLAEQNGKIYLVTDGAAIHQQGKLFSPEGEIHLLIDDNGLDTHRMDPLYQSGVLDVSGAKGGIIEIQASKCLQTGALLAEGQKGHGGSITIHTKVSYIETAQAKASVNAPMNGGSILIDAGVEGSLFSSGRLQASGISSEYYPTLEAIGGSIHLLGDRITLAGATLDASGKQRGGEILIGGDFHGANNALHNASMTFINGAAKLEADAQLGDGGKVIVWSEQKTEHYGMISAQGGRLGRGGLIEVSGKELFAHGSVSVASVNGKAGEVFFDPQNLVIDAVSGIYPQYEFIDPNAGNGSLFGATVLPLSTGNVVVAKPDDAFAAPNAGAVYLYNGLTAALISMITGTNTGDQVGLSIDALSQGNYLIRSPQWGSVGASNMGQGAATFVNGMKGIAGTVTAANSLVGGSLGDQVGSQPSVVLPNGDFLIMSLAWGSGGIANMGKGAVTFANAATGIVGTLSPSNSLVGSTMGDQVGLGGVVTLANGNYVVSSPDWNNGGTTPNAGAVTWGSGTSGVSGMISSANSLIGSLSNDQIGFNSVESTPFTSITPLLDGNFVVGSPSWNGGIGAATWASGTGGTVGSLSSSNSLIGNTTGDQIGQSITALHVFQSHYVIRSPQWTGSAANIGAATWANGPIMGTLTTSMAQLTSLFGTTSGDQVSFGGIVALANGNYVVISPDWNNGGTIANAGAVTVGSGLFGTRGQVNGVTASSLVGSFMNDQIGSGGVKQVFGSNFVVISPNWNNGGAVPNAGAVTWSAGTRPAATVTVSASNSLVGSLQNDSVGSGGVAVLASGNYVVISPNWNLTSLITNLGAVTFANGQTGTSGLVGLQSLLGLGSGDHIGSGGVVPLNNDAFVVISPDWNSTAGAVTWGKGASLADEVVSVLNSLVGVNSGDQIGSDGVVALRNGNFVAVSTHWSGGQGAVTWGNGTTGTSGMVSSSNSFVGTSTTDEVGSGGVLPLLNGNFIIASPDWQDLGAMTLGNGSNGTNALELFGVLNQQNSIVGQAANTGMLGPIADTVNSTFIASFPNEGSGHVRVGLFSVSEITFARAQAQTMTIPPVFITDILNTGASLTLQANNDITLTSPIVVNNPSGSGGSLTLSAGRSILVQANVITDDGNLTLIGNELLSNGVVDAYRNPGNAQLTIDPGITIDVGGGQLTIDLRNGAGKTNSASGNVTLGTGAQLLASGNGTLNVQADATNIVLEMNSLIQAQNGNILLIAGQDIIALSPATVRALGTGNVTMVVDQLFQAPSIGPGIFNIPALSISSQGGFVSLYAGNFRTSFLPYTINGAPYLALVNNKDPFLKLIHEVLGVYYAKGKHGSPYRIFYKNPKIAHSLNRYLISLSEAFTKWTPTAYGGYLSYDRYPPDMTPKDLILIIPSLVELNPRNYALWEIEGEHGL